MALHEPQTSDEQFEQVPRAESRLAAHPVRTLHHTLRHVVAEQALVNLSDGRGELQVGGDSLGDVDQLVG